MENGRILGYQGHSERKEELEEGASYAIDFVPGSFHIEAKGAQQTQYLRFSWKPTDSSSEIIKFDFDGQGIDSVDFSHVSADQHVNVVDCWFSSPPRVWHS